MSDTAPSPVRAETLVIAVIVALALSAVFYVMSQRQQALRSSPVGMDGLQHWAIAQGITAQTFTGGWLIDPAFIGLQILPLHDSEPGRTMTAARTKEELLFQQDEFDQDVGVIREKARVVPTLIVLPKWRSGMRLTGVAHPALLVETARVEAILREVTGSPLRMTLASEVFTTLPYLDGSGAELETQIYAAQLFDGRGCEPIIGAGSATLLARCPLAGGGRDEVWVLSDPDLLNNHGLRLGQNAAIADDFLRKTAGEATVLIDLSRDNWFAPDDAPPQRDRTWADLLRFLEPPFLAVWIGAAAVLVLILWRSLRRAGPVLVEVAAGSGKLQVVGARARLMRLTGQDGALLGDYARARIAVTAAQLVGPGHARQIGEERAFLRYLSRNRADLADRLEAVLARLHALPRHIPAVLAIQHVEEFELILEQIANEP